MMGYLCQRVWHAALTLVVAVSLVFIAVRALPRNPLLIRFGQHPVPEQFQAMMEAQGWNRPVASQLAQFLTRVVLRADLGESFMRPGERVRDELLQKVPATIELSCAAMLLAIPLGILAGVAAAQWQHQFPDHLCMVMALLGVSVPVFFLGICLVQVFTALPTGNRLPPGTDYQAWTGFVIADAISQGNSKLAQSALRHLCLPAMALSTIPMAIIARITRANMLECLSSDYIRTARAKGVSAFSATWRHAFPNAAIPIVNIAGLQLGTLLTGAVLTETVFNWPGLGRYLVDAVQNSDYAVVQGGALFIAAMFVTLNLVLDLTFVWLDPRLRDAS